MDLEGYGFAHGKFKTIWKYRMCPQLHHERCFQAGTQGIGQARFNVRCCHLLLGRHGPRDRRQLSAVNTQGDETLSLKRARTHGTLSSSSCFCCSTWSVIIETIRLDHKDKRKPTRSPTQPGALPASVTAGGDLGGTESRRRPETPRPRPPPRRRARRRSGRRGGGGEHTGSPGAREGGDVCGHLHRPEDGQAGPAASEHDEGQGPS